MEKLPTWDVEMIKWPFSDSFVFTKKEQHPTCWWSSFQSIMYDIDGCYISRTNRAWCCPPSQVSKNAVVEARDPLSIKRIFSPFSPFSPFSLFHLPLRKLKQDCFLTWWYPNVWRVKDPWLGPCDEIGSMQTAWKMGYPGIWMSWSDNPYPQLKQPHMPFPCLVGLHGGIQTSGGSLPSWKSMACWFPTFQKPSYKEMNTGKKCFVELKQICHWLIETRFLSHSFIHLS